MSELRVWCAANWAYLPPALHPFRHRLWYARLHGAWVKAREHRHHCRRVIFAVALSEACPDLARHVSKRQFPTRAKQDGPASRCQRRLQRSYGHVSQSQHQCSALGSPPLVGHVAARQAREIVGDRIGHWPAALFCIDGVRDCLGPQPSDWHAPRYPCGGLEPHHRYRGIPTHR